VSPAIPVTGIPAADVRGAASRAAETVPGVVLTRRVPNGCEHILSAPALSFVARLHRAFEHRRQQLLEERAARQQRIAQGELPDFLGATKDIRESDWKVASGPDEIADRRVEITGPVDRKMIINALNSGARVYMADFEDSNSPTWTNCVEGQANLRDAVNRTITFTAPDGKLYRLQDRTAVLFVRPRGWHLAEKHMRVDGVPVSASLFDFGLFLFHNARTLLNRGTRPYFYLPKLESHVEARLWNDVFHLAQDELGIPRGTIRATVLIENILAAFEMDEILWELRDHSVGLNCGRWDYIFSFIKKFRNRADFVVPDRGQVTMDRHFLESYVELLIRTCHRRGAHAMGGMAAQIPIKHDPTANERALDKVRQDKLREVQAGHDGTWVAHPGLVPIATVVFDAHMPRPNQIERLREDVRVSAADLLSVPEGTITFAGLRHNVDVGIQYLEAWLSGNGCVPIYNLMEDAATAEISRSQVWQWVRHKAVLEDGRRVTPDLVRAVTHDELQALRERLGPERMNRGRFGLAAELLLDLMVNERYAEWLTTVAYDYID
jgi:malate synthase